MRELCIYFSSGKTINILLDDECAQELQQDLLDRGFDGSLYIEADQIMINYSAVDYIFFGEPKDEES